MTRFTRSTARRTLALSTALAGGMLMLPAVAAAQTYGGFGTVNGGAVSAGGAAPAISNGGAPGAETLNVNLNAGSTVIRWNDFNVASGNTATFNNAIGGGNVAVLNQVTTIGAGNTSDLGGSIRGVGGVEVWVANPNGILLGANTNINTQGFVATTRAVDEGSFVGGGRTFALTQLAGASTGASITGGAGAPGAQIFTNGGLLALIAPVVQVSGTFNAGTGQAAFVAAEDVTFTADNGSPLAFTINRGASLGTGLSVDKSVAAGRAYMLVSAQTGIDALLNVGAGVTTATATPTGIVILAGQENTGAGVTFGGGDNAGTGRVQLAGLSSSAGGTLVGASNGITLNANLLSAGTQRFDGAVTLAKDVLVRSTGAGAAGDITFAGTVVGQHVLTVNTAGTTTFGGVVGGAGTARLANLLVNGGGATAIDGGAITSGAMAFTGPVTLGADTMLSGGTATFGAGLTGNAHDLTLSLTGDTRIDAAIAGVRNLRSNAGGRTLLAGTVTTSGSQTYDDAVVLTADTTLTTPTAAIALNNTVNGAYDLTLTTAGTKTLGGAVGAAAALDVLTLNGGGTDAIGAPTIRTAGDQVYADPVTLTASSTLTSAGAIGFASTVDSAVPGAAGLSVSAANGVTFGGAVGSVGRLASLRSNVTGTTLNNGGSVETQGDQTYGAVTLGAGTTLTGARLVRGLVTGNGNNLTLNFDTVGPIDSTLVGVNNLLVGWRTGMGTAIDLAGDVTTTRAQTYRDATRLSADATLTAGGEVTFQSTLDGGYDLTIDTAQTTRFGGAVGGVAALHRLTTTGGGITAIDGGLVRTVTSNNGPQNYNDAVQLGTDATLSGYSVAFNAGLAGNNHDLTLAPASTFTVNGGVITGVKNLTVTPTGGAGINLEGTITTSGSQAYNGATLLATPAVTLAAGADVTFGGTLNGGSDLFVNAGGTTSFNGNVGLGTRLGSITTDPLGATAINAAAIYTTGLQSYGDPVTLGAAGLTQLNSNAGGAISFGSSVDAATEAVQGLRVTTTATTTFGGRVGFSRRLANLIVDGGGATAINGGEVTTQNEQRYGGNITLGATTLLKGGAFVRAAGASIDGAGNDLTLRFDQATIDGSILNVRNLDSDGRNGDGLGTTRLGGTITTSGSQRYGNPTTLIAGTTLTAGTDPNRVGDVTFAHTLGGAFALAVNSPGTTTFGGAATIASLVTDAPGTTVVNGGLIRTLGNQDYGDAVTIGQQDASLQSTGNGTIRFRSTVDSAAGSRALTVASSNAITFDGAVGAANRLSSLTASGSAVNLNGGSVTTIGAQSYTGLVSLGTDTDLSGDHADFVTGVRGNDHDLNLITVGNQVLNGSTIQGVHDLYNFFFLGTLDLKGTLTTIGAQTYFGGATTLTGPTALASSGGGTIYFQTDIDGAQTLSVSTAGTVTFLGTFGNNTPLASLTVSSGAGTVLDVHGVRTSGGQTYNGAVTLAPDSGVTLIESLAGPVRFNGTIDGDGSFEQSLTVTAPGSTTFGGTIGGTVRLGSLTVNGGGTTLLNAGQVLTTGTQNYVDDVILGKATLLDAQGGDVAFGGALDGGYTLSVLSPGTTTFGGAVGTGAALLSLTTNAAGANVIAGPVVRTQYGQSYGGATTLAGDATLTSLNGATIAFGGAIDGAHALEVDTAGLTQFNGAIGGGAALVSLSTNPGGSTELNGGAITTTGAQTFGAGVRVGAETVLTSTGNGTIRFGSTLDGARALTVLTGGTTEFDGAVGGSVALLGLGTDAGGTTLINGGLVRTSGAQTYGDFVSLGLDTVLTGSDVTVGAGLEGNGNDLTLNVSGTATLTPPITGLGGLTTNSTGNGTAVTVLAGELETTGAQTYNTAVRLAGGAPVTLRSSGGGDIGFARTVDATTAGGEGLEVNTAGTTTFGGAVGAGVPLGFLHTDLLGSTLLRGGSVTTTGAQTFDDIVTLGSANVLTSTDAGAISFKQTVDGAFDLTVKTAGASRFEGDVGVGTALTSLTTDAGGTTTLDGPGMITVQTVGSQRFGDAVLLGSDTLLRSTGSGLIALAGTADGNRRLTVDTAGLTRLGGLVGADQALVSLAVTGGPTEITGGGVTTTVSQSYGGPVRVGALDATLTSTAGGAIGFASTLDGLSGAPRALAIATAGPTDFAGAIGAAVPLSALTVSGGGAIAIDGGIVTTTGAQRFDGPVTIGRDTGFTSMGAGDVTFGGTLDGGFAASVTTGGVTRFGGAVGDDAVLASLFTDAAGSTAIDGGRVTTTGAQTYLDAVTLGADARLTSIGAANLTFGRTIDGGHELSLATAGNVILSGVVGGNQPLAALALRAASVSSVAGNRVNRIAADVAAGLTFDDAGPLAVGTVDGLVGITTGAQPTRLSAGGLLTLANDITAGEVALTGGGIVQNAGVTVNAGAGTILLDGSDGAIALAGTLTTTNAGGNAVAIVDGGATTLGTITTGAGGTLTLGRAGGDALGSIGQTGGTHFATGTLLGNATGAVTLTEAGNTLDTVGAFTANGFALRDASAGLTIVGPLNAGTGDLGLRLDAGDLTLAGNLIADPGVITLTSPGTITQTAGAVIGGTLTGSSVGGTTINALSVARLGAFTNSGAGGITLNNGRALTVTGNVAAGSDTLSITAQGIDFTGQTVSAANAITLAGTSGSVIGATATAGQTLTATGQSVGIGTATATGGALTLTAVSAAGDLTVGTATAGTNAALSSAGTLTVGTALSAGGTATVTSAGKASLAKVTSAGALKVSASDLDLTGAQTAPSVTIVNNRAGTSAFNVGQGATGGFALTDAEVNLIATDALTLDGGVGRFAFTDVAFGDNVGRKTIDVLAINPGSRIDVLGAVKGTLAGRAIRFGGSAANQSDKAGVIQIVETQDGGGSLDFAGAALELRGDRIGAGRSDGFLSPIGFDKPGGLSIAQVTNLYTGNAASTLYNVRNIAGSAATPNQSTTIRAASLTVRYTDYALFQNTGDQGTFTGVELRDGLTIQGSGTASNQNTFALFGSINGVTGTATAVQGPTVISFSQIFTGATRVNGCLIGTGAGCLTSVVTQPPLNIFDASRLDVFRSADDLVLPFDPLVGSNNEALFSGITLLDVPITGTQCANDASDASCKQQTQTEGK